MVDTFNKFIVSSGGQGVRILRTIRPNETITPDDSLNLAAWLVAIAEHEASEDFNDVLKAVIGT